MNPKFSINYINNQISVGDSLKGDWHILPENPIKSLRFSIGNIWILLENYKEYNHLLEHINIMKKGNYVSKILIMGRKDEETDIIEFNFQTKRIEKRITAKYQEYNNQILTGWKQGTKGEPKFTYGKIS